MKEIRWKRTREYFTDFGIAYIAIKSTHSATLLHRHHHHFLLLLAPSFLLLMTLTPTMRPLRHVSPHRWSALDLKKLTVSLNAEHKQVKENILSFFALYSFSFSRFSLPPSLSHSSSSSCTYSLTLPCHFSCSLLHCFLSLSLFSSTFSLPSSPFLTVPLSRFEIQSFRDRLWVASQSSSLLYLPGNHTVSHSTAPYSTASHSISQRTIAEHNIAEHSTAKRINHMRIAHAHAQPTSCSIIHFP